jgi:hypothetical protein
MNKSEAAMAVFEAIHEALRATEKTREPMNALVIWTELGKGLAGKLERQGASRGLLKRLCADYCLEGGAAQAIDLQRLGYRVEPERRLDEQEASAAFTRALRAIEQRLLAEWGDTGMEERQRDYFMATVRGWFPVGLDIMRSLPALRGASEPEVHAALGAWCARYLPSEESGPADLGVRVERHAHAHSH